MMNPSRMKHLVLVSSLLLAAGCGRGEPLVLSGQVALESFPAAVTAAIVKDAGGAILAEAPLDANGAFALTVPAAAGVTIELVADGGTFGLVFPRSAGGVDYRFDVGTTSAPLDLGRLRFVGDPSGPRYEFTAECAGGLDSGDIAVCVDDAMLTADTCESGCHFDHEGGPGDHDRWGRDDDEEALDPSDGAGAGPMIERRAEGGYYDLPIQSAVAEHNLPAFVGCAEDEDEDERWDDERDER